MLDIGILGDFESLPKLPTGLDNTSSFGAKVISVGIAACTYSSMHCVVSIMHVVLNHTNNANSSLQPSKHAKQVL